MILDYNLLKLIIKSNLYIKIDLFTTEPLKTDGSTIIFKDVQIYSFKATSDYNLDINEYFESGNVSIVRGKLTSGSKDGDFNIEITGANSGDTIYKITIEPIIIYNYTGGL